MKISYRWLQEFVDLEIAAPQAEDVIEALTRLGLAIESFEEVEEDDYLLDVDVPTNRPDCLNHVGVARELAAHFNLKLRLPSLEPPASAEDSASLPAHVEIADPDLCPRYSARVLSGVEIRESPAWLRERLSAAGQRPINNVVDVTNFVLLELGQPLHAFDYDKLKRRRIEVRRARSGEKLTTLDGVERQLDDQMLMICDGAGVTAVAGVMGGADSEISEATRTILLESAYFEPASVRRTAKTLGLRTEASYRFERGSDPELPVKALNRACRLLTEIAGARCAGPVIDQYPGRRPPTQVALSQQRVEQVTGLQIDPEFVRRTLGSLGFEVAGDTPNWKVQAPSYRVDIELADDLVEEVLRHYGYHRVEGVYPHPAQSGQYLQTESLERRLLSVLEGHGFYEAYNFIFTTPEREESFWGELRSLLPLSNPLSQEDSHLRASLLPGLIGSLRHNLNHGNERLVRLCETGKVYESGNPPGEEARLGLIAYGTYYEPFWESGESAFNYHHLKGAVESLLESVQVEAQVRLIQDVPYLHPGLSGEIHVNGDFLGYLGQLHPRLQSEYKFREPVWLAELSLDRLYTHAALDVRYRPLIRYPSLERDLSFLVDKTTEYATIEAAVKALNIPDLQDIRLIDFYQGPKLPTDKVSLTVRLTFANSERTLTQEEVQGLSDGLFETLHQRVGAELRS